MKQPQDGNGKDQDPEDDHIVDGKCHDPDCNHDHGAPKAKGGPKKDHIPTEEELQKQITMLEVARNRIEAFSREAEIIASALRDHARASDTLDAIKSMPAKKPSEVLIPVGAGVFMYAKPASTNTVLMNIGNGINAEFSIKDAIDKIAANVKDLEDKEKKVVTELSRLEGQAEALTRQAQAMYEQMQRAKQ
jgi:prefoldin alpha subunit